MFDTGKGPGAPDVGVAQREARRLRLDSGHQILVRREKNEDLLEIVEPEGEVAVTIRLTPSGPVITAQGARLELKAEEAITMESKKVEIKATEEAVLKSEGTMKIESAGDMGVTSQEEVKVVGKMIYLN